MKLSNLFTFKSLRQKLVTYFLLIGLIPAALAGYFAYSSSKDSLISDAGHFLEQTARDAIDKIDRNLFERYGDVQAFSFNPKARGTRADVTEATNFFTKTYGIYDLMVVADRNGRIVGVNTVDHQGKALNTSRLVGRSVRGEEWFEKAISGAVRPGETYYKDLEEDSLVAEVYGGRGLTLNFSAPVYDENGQIVRVWSNRASNKRVIGEIMAGLIKELEEAGIHTAEAQVISKEGLLIEDYDENAILKVNLVDLGLQAAKNVVAGEKGYTMETHLRKKVDQINGYATSHGALGFDGYGWSVIVREEAQEAFKVATALRNKIAMKLAIVAVLIIAFVLFLIRGIVKPINDMTVMIRDIAEGEGDLTKRIQVNTNDEIGEMSRWFNVFVEKVHGIIKQIAGTTNNVNNSAEDLSTSSQQMSAGADEQSSKTSQVAASVEEMSATIQEVAKNASTAVQSAKGSGDIAKKGEAIVDKTIDGINRIAQSVSEQQAVIQSLNKNSEQIGNVVNVINDVADQTNLLALNAAIEAARAGEQGRGFAVVADEVRKLAERTTSSTKEIANMVRTIQEGTAQAVSSMEKGSVEVKDGVNMAQQAGQALREIVNGVDQVQNLIQQIATATEEQSAAAEEISSNVESIASVTKQSAQESQRTTNSSEDLRVMANSLQDLVDKFKVGQENKANKHRRRHEVEDDEMEESFSEPVAETKPKKTTLNVKGIKSSPKKGPANGPKMTPKTRNGNGHHEVDSEKTRRMIQSERPAA